MRRNLVIKYYCHRPADDLNAGGGTGETTPAAVDRGDDFTPPSDEVVPSAPAATDEVVPPVADTEGHAIPKARFDEVNTKFKAGQDEIARLTAELAAARAQPPAAPAAPETPPAAPVDPVAALEDAFTERAATLQDQINQAMFDGDGTKAGELQKQLIKETTAFSRQVAKLEAEQLASSTYDARTQAEQARTQAETAVADVTHRFPQFDAKSTQFDAAATDEMADLADFYASKGLPLDQAIAKAANTIAAGKGFAEAGATNAAADAVAAASASRTSASRAAMLDAARAAAPVAPVGGPTSTTITPAQAASMSDKDFSKLSDEDKAKARGDDFVPTA